jgi:hypothetical protein
LSASSSANKTDTFSTKPSFLWGAVGVCSLFFSNTPDRKRQTANTAKNISIDNPKDKENHNIFFKPITNTIFDRINAGYAKNKA